MDMGPGIAYRSMTSGLLIGCFSQSSYRRPPYKGQRERTYATGAEEHEGRRLGHALDAEVIKRRVCGAGVAASNKKANKTRGIDRASIGYCRYRVWTASRID